MFSKSVGIPSSLTHGCLYSDFDWLVMRLKPTFVSVDCRFVPSVPSWSIYDDKSTQKSAEIKKLLRRVHCVAHRRSSLFCNSVTYLVYTSACRVVYTIPLAYIHVICELALNLIFLPWRL